MRVIFYSALESAPTTRVRKTTTDSESLDDTDRVLEDLKRNQSNYNDDNFEISNSPKQLNRFDALQLDDESEEKTKAEINVNSEDASSDEEEEPEATADDENNEDEDADESPVEPIREEVLAYGQSTDKTRKNLSVVVNREELIYLLKSLYTHKTTAREDLLTIGMVRWQVSFVAEVMVLFSAQVGYPNVGKSSTINSLLQYKKVSVSSTPGKTKHFQVSKQHGTQ